MSPSNPHRISSEELARIHAENSVYLGSSSGLYHLEDRYREAPADGWNGTSARPKYVGGNDEKRSLARVGDRLGRQSFGDGIGELTSGLLAKVYGLLAFSLVFTAVGVLVGYSLEPGVSILMFVIQLGLIFAINANRDAEGINLALLYAFCVVTGVALGPLIATYVDLGMRDVIFQALAATALVTVGMSVIGLSIKEDLSALWSLLFCALLGFVGLHLLNLFFGLPESSVLLSFLGVLLFSAFIVVDVNRIRYLDDTMGNAVLVCLDLYLDIVNLFVNLLQILVEAAISGDD